MHLTAVFKLRANNHDRALLRVALGRWSAAMTQAMDRARPRQRELLRCLYMWQSKDGAKSKMVVNRQQLHALTLECCRGIDTHLHSSASMSLVVAVEEQLGSWLGLYLDWLAHDRKLPKPGFPTVPPATAAAAEACWETAVDQARTLADDLAVEDRWRAEVQRASKARLLPLYFGACTSGGPAGQAHCGLIQRPDGRLFALLTLWPTGDRRGEPVVLARNRIQRVQRYATATGTAAHNLVFRRSFVSRRGTLHPPTPFACTDRARCSVMIPLEFSRGDHPTSAHGRENMFLRRAVPKSAELIPRGGEWWLHVAFEFPEHPACPLTGCVLSLRRGISTLLAFVVLDPRGVEVERGVIEGKTLAQLVTVIKAHRAQVQAKMASLKGDRRLRRVTEGHLYSAAHQIRDLACRHGAEIVMLEDPGARQPQRFLAYRHFTRLADALTQLAREAGLPPPRERRIYTSWATCLQCGWQPGDPVRDETVEAHQCPACATPRDPEFHLAALLAWDTLRLRDTAGEKVRTGDYIRAKRHEITS